MVADVDGDRVTEVVRRSLITHLGEGWTRTGRLSAEGIERVGAAVAGFVEEARSLGVQDIRCVATSAARDAGNAEEFRARIGQTGVLPEVISGDREARLTFLGATRGLRDRRVLVVDIGGGSTELVVGEAARGGARDTGIEVARSIDVGARRVTELFLHDDPPTRRQLDDAVLWIAGELKPFFSALRERPDDMVSVAGTATSYAAIDLALEPYDPERVHGYRLSGPALLGLVERLAGMTLAERRQVAGLEPERAGVIVAGGLVLQAVIAYSGLASTLVSEQDILYGIVLEDRDDA